MLFSYARRIALATLLMLVAWFVTAHPEYLPHVWQMAFFWLMIVITAWGFAALAWLSLLGMAKDDIKCAWRSR
ncbi:hypothetical protein A3B35_03475 [Candidatus Kaiserbacteria bacterium RIFCSPLOWO2_01_FULL_54_24]|uniref:Uncharacterized protein n=1 Tax=Candidatus Kaiserbacteria bacterium RIFCSPLOWO2_01_FULL_54_24 TaxID=1798515 RepID=A0A1F6ET48_9BACT|nr:MAG: hypothetical protein A3B35_03475 [Candidatus Kaiserbacteria bacterium RIFCSPLOWO2_01_FULL_54_24]